MKAKLNIIPDNVLHGTDERLPSMFSDHRSGAMLTRGEICEIITKGTEVKPLIKAMIKRLIPIMSRNLAIRVWNDPCTVPERLSHLWMENSKGLPL